MMREETEYWVMRLLEARPDLSQRDLARELGVSLGKAHYCIKSVIDKGWMRAVPHKKGHERGGYQYALTSLGRQQQELLTVRFMASKMREYEGLRAEFERVQRGGRRRVSQSQPEGDGATDGE
jgi:EPS-associated MarR family transcriptional regulator